MSTTVDVDVYAHDRSASSTFDRVGNAAARNAGGLKHFGATLAGVFTGAALYNGARDLTHLLVDMGAKAADDEESTRRLALQLHNSAHATDIQVASVEDWITAQGQALGVTDDELRPALARATTATHDLAAAQDDVSLAMDVAAGKQKSLQSVVEALSRGEDGNTASLARLGVQTKDAAGHALTFDQITQQLAKTFHGQAAAAADTAAGRYKILRTEFGELEESIGYKLLPVATDLGNWMLDDGVPAAQELTHWLGDELGPTVRDIGGWFSDNQDDIENFAKVVGQDVVGGLKTVVQVGGGAVRVFNALPDPLRAVTAEVAIAAAVIPKLSNAINGMTGAIGLSEGKLGGWRKALVLTAGVAGIGAIEEGARTGSHSVSILGDALTGAFVGGTLGSAIPLIGTGVGAIAGAAAGAGAGLIQMQKAADKAGDSSKNATPDVEGLAASLNQLTGATTAATRAEVLKDLQTAHAIDAGAALGLTTRELINASLGQQSAYNKMQTTIKTATLSSNEYMDSQGAVHRTNEAAYRSAALLTQTIDGLGDSVDKTRADVLAQAIAAEDLTSVYRAFPRKVATEIDAEGIVPTAKGVAELAIKYDAMDKRHVQALISAAGTDLSVTQVQRVINKLNELHDKTVHVDTIYTTTGKAIPLPGGGSTSSKSSGGGSGKTPRTGSNQRSLTDILGDRLRGSSDHGWGGLGHNQLTTAGADLLSSLVSGIEKGRKPLNKVLNAIHHDIENKLKARDQLQALHDQLAGGFSGFQESVFSVQGTDAGPVTLDQLLAKAASEKAKAAQVDQDVQALLNGGVSQDLIQQLQSEGGAGIEALHALAGANADQIKQIVDDNAAAQASYAHSGQVTADKFYNQAIAQANAQLAIAQGVEKTVQKIDDLASRIERIEFTIHGSDLVASLVKDKKNKGKQ